MISKIKETNVDKTKEQVKNLVMKVSESIIKTQQRNLLLNHSKTQYIYSAEEQKKVAQTFGEACIKGNVEKFAFMIPEDNVFSEISHHQTLDKTGDLPLEIKFFKNLSEAMNWLEI